MKARERKILGNLSPRDSVVGTEVAIVTSGERKMRHPGGITQEMIRLYDEFTHLTLDRRDFIDKLTRLTGQRRRGDGDGTASRRQRCPRRNRGRRRFRASSPKRSTTRGPALP